MRGIKSLLSITPKVGEASKFVPRIGMLSGFTGGGEDVIGNEMKALYKKDVKFDNKKAIDIVRGAATRSGVNPALLFSSSFQEGFNKAIAKPDEVSEAYQNAKIGGDYPVDGFYNYGLDTFGDKYEKLKQYLPEGFDQRFKTYKAKNEKDEWVTTAAFKSNEDALTAKGAFIRSEMDYVNNLAKQRGIELGDAARNYFTMAAYNTKHENVDKMFDRYIAAKDKKAWLDKGDENWQRIHTNISPRMKHMAIANELLNEQTNQ
jgi:hypothetical protein